MNIQGNRYLNAINLTQAPSLSLERGSLRAVRCQESVEINSIEKRIKRNSYE